MITGLYGFIVLFVLILFFKMPIGFAMILVGFLGMAYLTSFYSAIDFLGHQVFATAASYDMAMVAMFIFMGELAFAAGLGRRAYASLLTILGRIKGSLAIATIGGCAAFAAVCGSSPATAATIGSIALPEMRRHGYDDGLATGSVAAGGTLGILIPPSLGFILFGILTEQSIAKLYLAGVLPGILLASLFMVVSYTYALIKSPASLAQPTPVREKILSLKDLLDVIALFVIVIGGMGVGLFTPTAAGAVGTAGVMLVALIRRSITFQGLLEALERTISTVGMIVIIFVGAMTFNYFLAATTLPFKLGQIVSSLPVPPVATIAFILFVWLVLGCVMDAIGMIVLTLPIVYPIVLSLGFSPIWFAVLGVIMIEAGLITPPVGMNLFVISGIAKDVPIGTIYKGAIPYVLAVIACVTLLMLFPQIALFLPEAVGR